MDIMGDIIVVGIMVGTGMAMGETEMAMGETGMAMGITTAMREMAMVVEKVGMEHRIAYERIPTGTEHQLTLTGELSALSPYPRTLHR